MKILIFLKVFMCCHLRKITKDSWVSKVEIDNNDVLFVGIVSRAPL